MAATAETNLSERLGDSTYPSDLSYGLNQLRQQATLCDVTIVVGDQQFPAHKAVLSVASNYFQCMFSSGFQESTSKEVTVPGTSDSFAQLLEFAYTGYFYLSPATVAGIFSMACYMHFAKAVEVCANYLSEVKDEISIEDCFEIWSVAGNHESLSNLVESFHQHLIHNFPKCVESASFLEHATAEFVQTCIEDEEIETDTSTELQILQVVNSWLKHDWVKRKVHTNSLLKSIRLGLVPLENLKELLASDIAEITECKEMLEEVIRLQCREESCVEDPLSHSHRAWFATRNTISALLKIGKQGSSYFDDTCCAGGAWKRLDKFATLPYPAQGHLSAFSLAAINRKLYAAGGEAKHSVMARGRPLAFRCISQCVDNFCEYNSDVNKWQNLCPMKTSRKSFVMLGHGGFIYAIGGMDNQGEMLVQVERYSISDNVWEDRASLKLPVEGTSVVWFSGKVVLCSPVMRPRDDVQLAMQLYDPDKDVWHCALNATYDDDIEIYSTLLTVYNDMLYYVSYVYDESDGKYVRRSRVVQMVCNFESEPPSIEFGDNIDQSAIPETSMKAFCIGDKVFINKYKCVQQVPAIKTSGADVYDLSRWQNIRLSGQGNIAFCTLDKQRLLTRITK